MSKTTEKKFTQSINSNKNDLNGKYFSNLPTFIEIDHIQILETDYIEMNQKSEFYAESNINNYLTDADEYNINSQISEFLRTTTLINNYLDNDGRTALHYAVMCKNIKVINDILQNPNANKNAQDNYGYTPLHLIAKKATENNFDDYMSCLYKLAENNNNINITDNKNLTALDYVKNNSKFHLIAEIIERNGGQEASQLWTNKINNNTSTQMEL